MPTGNSYLDHLQPGEALGLGVRDVCEQLEREGWTVETRTKRGFRYWCPGEKCGKHQFWIDTQTLVHERLEFYLSRSCLTFN